MFEQLDIHKQKKPQQQTNKKKIKRTLASRLLQKQTELNVDNRSKCRMEN